MCFSINNYYDNKDKIIDILVKKLNYTRVGDSGIIESYEPYNSDFLLRVSTGDKDVALVLSSKEFNVFDELELKSHEISLENVVEFLCFYGYPPAVRLSRILIIDEIIENLA